MFVKGDKVVYPHHGAGIIDAIKDRTVFSEKQKYYILKLSVGQLMISIPVDTCHELGLRSVINRRQAAKVIKMLTDKASKDSDDCSERYKLYCEKVSTGDVHSVAEVIRDLNSRSDVSAREKRLFTKAKKILISELSYAYKKTDEEMTKKIDGVLIS